MVAPRCAGYTEQGKLGGNLAGSQEEATGWEKHTVGARGR